MSLFHSNSLIGASGQGGGDGGYTIDRSVRFNSTDSSYLNRTFTTATNAGIYTFSAWVKRSALSDGYFFSGGTGSSIDTNWLGFAGDSIAFSFADGGAYLTTSAVYRDPSAWYHVLVAVDLTQATASNRVKLYVNGTQITSFSSSTYPNQNGTYYINRANQHTIGARYRSSIDTYFNGYIADAHFVDGQALTPTSFGEFDTNGVWQPKEYTGSYGTNGFHLPFSDNSTSAALGTDTSGNNNTWTVNNISVTNTYPTITQAKIYSSWGGGSRGANYTVQYSDDNSNWTTAFTGNMSTSGCGLVTGSGSGNGSYGPHRYWRYVIGATTNTHHPNAARYILSDGVTDYNILVAAADNCSDTGTWGPEGTTYSASLPLLTTDSLVDSPTNGNQTDTGVGGEVVGNYCTWNPLDKGANALTLPSNGNLDFKVTSTAGIGQEANQCATFGVSSGKWYWEIIYTDTTAGGAVGILSSQVSMSANPYSAGAGNYYTYQSSGNKHDGTGATSYGSTWSTGDVIGVALDLDAGTIVFYKNGASQGQAFSGITGTFKPHVYVTASGSSSLGAGNFGQRPFAYTAPSGYKALCTANLPTPTIADGSTAMDVVLYTGNGSTQTISGLGFSPDLVWIKQRNTTRNNYLFDVIRGANVSLISNNTTPEDTTQTNTVTGFTSDGWTMGGSDRTNAASGTYVGWAWDAGSSTVTNNNGSISSQVRTNPNTGFSIVTYTGTGAAATVGHGLGVKPALVIAKGREVDQNWLVWHKNLTGETYYVHLETTGAEANNSAFFSAFSSTTFSLGNSAHINSSGLSNVAYCFAPVAGYSSFGSYTGNGSDNGPFIYTGFRPAFVIAKSISAVGGWTTVDNTRDPINSAFNNILFPNSTDAENSGANKYYDFTSNGFKIRGTSSAINTNSVTYFYIAFAESPFQIARAR